MIEIVTLDGGRTGVDAAAIAALRDRVRGGVVLAGDADYETARRVWNGNVDRRPALIARCTGIGDVQHAVGFANANGLLVSVRGGGHSAPGYGTNDGGMVIDLSRMKQINVDPGRRTACPVARIRHGDAGIWPRHHWRHGFQYRRFRPDIGRRTGLADG